jgi:hypothetical protein
MIRCPICRGRVDEVTSRCTRCDTDLSYLIMIEKSCHDHCYLAIQAIHQSEWELARVYASQALHLKSTPFTQTLRRFAFKK